MATPASPASGTARYPFYALVAFGALLLVFAGFARSYYLKVQFGTPVLPLLVHLHGAVMTGWFVLLFVQAGLIETHRTAVHRRLGVLAAGWALLVLVVGVATAIHAARLGFTAGPPPLVFLVVPLMDLVVFGSLTGSALLYRGRPEIHRRLMLMGSVGILAPAIARLPIGAVARGGLPVIFGLMILVAVGCVAFDTWRYRRLHPAFGWGLLVVVSSVPLRVALGGTAAWQRFAAWLIS
ncbi:MAG: hypothetical protein ABI742_13195 [Gemmatimonadota bacterium]